ncbi:hypothetical protein [Vibrio rumoiensis]|uniref:hypothetical protein n=1 Tax=Vibrio rumoiensis TaxID=76258 RepID=UPI003AA8D1C0
MSEQYWDFNEETLIINQNGLPIKKRAGQDLYPRTALLTKPLEPKDDYQVLAVLDANGCAIDSEYVEDHRGKTIYNTQDCKQSKIVEKLGVIEDDWTLLKPSTQFDEWIDSEWVTNEQMEYEAQVQQVDAIRRALYLNVDALRNKAAMIRVLEADETKAADYDEQAKALYLKIRNENPWP